MKSIPAHILPLLTVEQICKRLNRPVPEGRRIDGTLDHDQVETTNNLDNSAWAYQTARKFERLARRRAGTP